MKETRHIEIRAAQAENNTLVIEGVPVVFDTPTQINDPKGSYTEVISRHALKGVDLNDTRLLYNHDLKRIPLARTPNTMELTLDDKGLNMRAELPNTEEGRSVYTAVQRGDLTGMSFSFTTDQAGSKYNAEKRTRFISKINKIFECSIVPFPAYQTTSVEARSLIDEAERLKQEREKAQIMLNKILFRGVK